MRSAFPTSVPGHLSGHEEWSNSPIRPGSEHRLRSGMHLQVDVIPVPMPDGWALDYEDGVVLADARLRAELAVEHAAVAARIDARRAFLRDVLGVPASERVLPRSPPRRCAWRPSG